MQAVETRISVQSIQAWVHPQVSNPTGSLRYRTLEPRECLVALA
jgi:hypothetical protein